MKYIIFDAGPLISFAMNGLLDILEKLKKEFPGEFIITPEVKKEVIDRPLQNKKYELEGIKISDLLSRSILKLSSEFIKNPALEKETSRILNIANSSFKADKNISLIQRGEASCLAFSNLCGCENLIAIDERTTRMLVEDPDGLKKIMEMKLHLKITIDKQNIKKLNDFRFIRSSELLYIAYKKNLFNLKKDNILLDALLYAVKYTGTAISQKEIEELKKLA
jgi:hypothetical protein